MATIAAQLKALRNRTSPKISVRSLAERLDVPASTYAAYEDENKFKKPILPLDLAKRIADVFEERGVARAETLRLAGVTGDLTIAVTPDPEEWVEVSGTVAAGVWREQSEWPEAERYLVRFGATRFPGLPRFGLRMDGLSMNRTIPPGSDLECIGIQYSTMPPKPGDLVIVERTAHDLTEMTCKRLDQDGDDWILRCESTEPEFQDVIRIGKPDNGAFIDEETRVVAIVVSAKLDLAPVGMSERRFKR